jgi:23S rRNA (uracil1939-C5)-methyltransferase
MSTDALLEIEIESLSYGVHGVARTDQGVVLVPATAPGDRVRARIVEVKPDYREAQLVEVLKPSALRRTPPCRYVPECGGCPWQHLDYPAQLAAKERILRDALQRIGGLSVETLEIRPILPSREWGYRHRVNLRVDGEQRLGFFRHRSHRLVEIEECGIADPVVNRHLAIARQWLRGASTAVRRLEIARAGPDAVAFIGNAEGPFRHDDSYHESFLRGHPTVRGILLHGRGWRRAFGTPRAVLELGEELWIETSGFTQVNPEGNRCLIESAIELAAPGPQDEVLDLYCGAGNLTLPLARRVASVTGVERDPWTLADARRNADRAGLRNCRFVQQDAAAAARGFASEGRRFPLVVLDPPRSGAAEVLPHLAAIAAERLLYVSCNPATLARDLRRLVASGFRLGPLQPIDLFPQTYHLETVAQLSKGV